MPLEVIWPDLPCSSKATHSQLPRTISKQFLNISSDGDFSTSPGNPCQCSITFTVIKYFLYSEGTSCVSVRAHCPSAVTPDSLFLVPSFQCFYTLMEFPPAFSSSRTKNHSSLSLSSQVRWSSQSSSCHFAGLSCLAPFPSCAGEPRTGHSTTGAMKITK